MIRDIDIEEFKSEGAELLKKINAESIPPTIEDIEKDLAEVIKDLKTETDNIQISVLEGFKSSLMELQKQYT